MSNPLEVLYMWARNGKLPQIFTGVDYDIPVF